MQRYRGAHKQGRGRPGSRSHKTLPALEDSVHYSKFEDPDIALSIHLVWSPLDDLHSMRGFIPLSSLRRIASCVLPLKDLKALTLRVYCPEWSATEPWTETFGQCEQLQQLYVEESIAIHLFPTLQERNDGCFILPTLERLEIAAMHPFQVRGAEYDYDSRIAGYDVLRDALMRRQQHNIGLKALVLGWCAVTKDQVNQLEPLVDCLDWKGDQDAYDRERRRQW
ncbi:hypothetical protein FA95DRAFT_1555680 [Auriscalpium vulgare]|uniref:Uncharacterized protein n=1 Tax=Auriscalpium vulgare TaxID=40419 RepID=A0ACB8S2Q8_9AGAM|nr:hypothetical protein FA95DRAFT_1555680 [Auriscalpium vulgare]